jgi:hypothetical protein
MEKHEKDGPAKGTFLQIRISEDLKEDLRITAQLKGLTPSALINSLIVKAVREMKAEEPSAFPDFSVPRVVADETEIDRIIKEAYIESFGGGAIDPERLRRLMRTATEIKKMMETTEVTNSKDGSSR